MHRLDLPDSHRVCKTIKRQSPRLRDSIMLGSQAHGATMAEDTKVTLEELVISTLAMTDALAKLLIARGVIRTRSSKRS
jgi:hypothetical protein